MMNKDEFLQELSDCVLDFRDEEVADVAQDYIDAGYGAYDGIFYGLVDGMNRAAQLYEEEEYFVPELLLCSDAMYNGLDVLRPYVNSDEMKQKCKVAIGVVEGDTHDIGKNLVKIMMEASGYEMLDLGRDVPIQNFVDAVSNDGCQALALSTLMSTSMTGMADIIKRLEVEGLRDNVKVIVGGGPLSHGYAKKIGADGYSNNAVEAVELLDSLMGFES